MGLLVRGKYAILEPGAGPALPVGTQVEDRAVLVSGSRISEVGDFKTLRRNHPGSRVIGNGRQLLMPGLVDGHSHGWGLTAIQRGILYDFLENALLDWAFMADLDPELNAMLSGLRHLRSGCTTVHHNGIYEGPNGLAVAEKTMRGYQRIGVRFAYSPGVRNENILALGDREFLVSLPPDLQQEVRSLVELDKERIVDEYIDLFDELHRRYNNEDTRVIFGPTWVQGSTDDYLVRVKQRADELGKVQIHMHTLQTPIQKAYGLRKYGKSLLAHLDDLGLVDENLTLGHAVWLDAADIELLADRRASTTHHPSCNLAMRNGIAPIYHLHRAGVNVALGIDDKGINDDEDAIMELRMIHRLHRSAAFDLATTPALSGAEVLRMGTLNAARVCGFEGQIGALKPGMKADLILVDLDEMMNDPLMSAALPMEEIFIHRAKGSHVNTVIVGGQVVMEDHQIRTVDVGALYEEVRQRIGGGISAEQRRTAETMLRIKPYYQKWYEGWTEFESAPFYVLNSRV